jgi:hypothetical protein
MWDDVHPAFFVVVYLVVVFIIQTLWNPVEAKKVFDDYKIKGHRKF